MRNVAEWVDYCSLHITTLEENVEYEITEYNGNVIASGVISLNYSTIVPINTDYVVRSGAFTERNKGLHLTSSAPISAVVEKRHLYYTSAYPVYPNQTLSSVYQYEYIIVNPFGFTDILLVGTEDDSVVSFIPSWTSIDVPVEAQDPSDATQTLFPGETKQYTLHRLQTLRIEGIDNLDALFIIISDKPLTVIANFVCWKEWGVG